MSLTETSDQKIQLTFKNHEMQDFFKKWCEFKNAYENEKAEILTIEDEIKKNEELDKLNDIEKKWKLNAMGTALGCHSIVRKGTSNEGIRVRIVP